MFHSLKLLSRCVYVETEEKNTRENKKSIIIYNMSSSSYTISKLLKLSRSLSVPLKHQRRLHFQVFLTFFLKFEILTILGFFEPSERHNNQSTSELNYSFSRIRRKRKTERWD